MFFIVLLFMGLGLVGFFCLFVGKAAMGIILIVATALWNIYIPRGIDDGIKETSVRLILEARREYFKKISEKETDTNEKIILYLRIKETEKWLEELKTKPTKE